jgi:hypothetical protein
MATVRSSRVSRARYTSPIPPAPIGSWISYGPSLVPAVSPIVRTLYVIGVSEPCAEMLGINETGCPTSRAVYARDVGIFASSAQAHRITTEVESRIQKPHICQEQARGAPAERFRSIGRLGSCWGRPGRSCGNVGDERTRVPHFSRGVYGSPRKLSTKLLLFGRRGGLYGCRAEIEGSSTYVRRPKLTMVYFLLYTYANSVDRSLKALA